MLSVIVSDNKEKRFVRVEDDNRISLTDRLEMASFFSREFDDELSVILKRVRKTRKDRIFKVVKIDEALVDDDRLYDNHFKVDWLGEFS